MCSGLLDLVIAALAAAGLGGCGEPQASTAAALPPGPVIHVSPRGDNDSSGRPDAPLESITEAVDRLQRGGVVQLAAGSYPAIDDRASFPKSLVFRGPRAKDDELRTPRVARFAGATLRGSSSLRFESVAFDGPVEVTVNPLDHSIPATDIAFVDSEFTDPDERCVMIRDGAQRVRVVRSWIHDCKIGMGGYSATTTRSTNVQIRDNVLERFTIDGIAFGSWDNVAIVGNRIRHIVDPNGREHNDGIQIQGASSRIRIEGNHITDSRSQLMLIQGDLGPITDVTVVNNVFAGSEGTGIQAGHKSSPLTFVNNTLWDTRFSALLLRVNSGALPEVVLVNNIIDGLGKLEGVEPKLQRANLIVGDQQYARKGDIKTRKVRFEDAAKGNFRLRPQSPARGQASAKLAPRFDITGKRRAAKPSIGAYD